MAINIYIYIVSESVPKYIFGEFLFTLDISI